MANYSSIKSFYETFKNELSSSDFETSEEEPKLAFKANNLRRTYTNTKKNYSSFIVQHKKTPTFEFVEVDQSRKMKEQSPISISSSESTSSIQNSTFNRKKFKNERKLEAEKIVERIVEQKNGMVISKKNSQSTRKVMYQEFTRTQRGRICRKPNHPNFQEDY